jgi:hypothetical protein
MCIRLIAVAFALGSPAVLAQPAPFRVEVTTQATSDIVANAVTSCMSRNLQALGDVVVTQSNPEFTIGIVMLEHRNPSGAPTGNYSMSVTTTFHIGHDLRSALKGKMPDQAIDQVALPYESAVLMFDHSLVYGRDFDRMCGDAVDKFEADCLTGPREIKRKLQEDGQKSAKAPDVR